VPEKDVQVEEVKAFRTSSGNTRFVLRDHDGNEYTTFKEPIARAATAAEGKRAHIKFHEQQRGEFTNVYLDGVEVLEDDPPEADDGEGADEVGWKAAIDAAPWLLGTAEPKERLAADEFYETLRPFKELVAEDIRDGSGDDE
jgi:hypothetical protein